MLFDFFLFFFIFTNDVGVKLFMPDLTTR